MEVTNLSLAIAAAPIFLSVVGLGLAIIWNQERTTKELRTELLGAVAEARGEAAEANGELRAENVATRTELLGAVAEARGEAAKANREFRAELQESNREHREANEKLRAELLGAVAEAKGEAAKANGELRAENVATRTELLGAVEKAKGEAAAANKELRAEFRGALDKVWLVLVDLRERVSRIEGHLRMPKAPPTSAEPAEAPHRALLEAPAELPPAAGDVEHHVSR